MPAALRNAPLVVNDVVQPVLDLVELERVEAEARAARLDGGNDLVDVVADDAEAHVARVLLDDCAKGELSNDASCMPSTYRDARRSVPPSSWHLPRRAR